MSKDAKKGVEHYPSSYEDRYDPKNLASNPFAFPIGVWTSPEAAYYGLSTDSVVPRAHGRGEKHNNQPRRRRCKGGECGGAIDVW